MIFIYSTDIPGARGISETLSVVECAEMVQEGSVLSKSNRGE